MNLKLGKRIREVRENAGLNQKQFCAALEIPQSTLSAYETDKMQPTIVSLVNIATKFSVSLDWLCGIENCVTGDTEAGLSEDLNDALAEAAVYLKELEEQRQNESARIKKLRGELLTAAKKGRDDK